LKNKKGGTNMSVVVAIKEKGKIHIGADTQISYGNMKSDAPQGKLFKHPQDDDLVVGIVGYARTAVILKYKKELFNEMRVKAGMVNMEYLVNEWYLDILEYFKKYNHAVDDKESLPSTIMIAYKDHCFLIDRSGYIEELEEGKYFYIGSGAQVAAGSLSTTEGEDPDERIRRAIEAAGEKTLYVNRTVEMFTTQKR
jgi:ATP-dependent protease HslVU (ClpYQ) peptidase subunit